MAQVKAHTRKTKKGQVRVKAHRRTPREKASIGLAIVGGLAGTAFIAQPMMALAFSELTFAQAVPLFWSNVFPRILPVSIISGLAMTGSTSTTPSNGKPLIVFVGEKISGKVPHNIGDLLKDYTPKNTFVVLAKVNGKQSLLWLKDDKNNPSTLVFASKTRAKEHAENWSKHKKLKGKQVEVSVLSIEDFSKKARQKTQR